jgi:hypothetical protein
MNIHEPLWSVRWERGDWAIVKRTVAVPAVLFLFVLFERGSQLVSGWVDGRLAELVKPRRALGFSRTSQSDSKN